MIINEYNFMKITMFTEKFWLHEDIAAVTCWGSFTSSLNPKNYLDDELQTIMSRTNTGNGKWKI